MPTYKLIYFDGVGRAEVPRWLFLLADVEYEDHRIAMKDWKTIKPTTQLGYLPMLEVDGERISQSLTIIRLLAHKFGFAGKTEMEMARVEMILDATNDLFVGLTNITFDIKDAVLKAEEKKKYETEILPTTMSYLEKLAGDKYFVGDSITAADLYFAFMLDYYQEIKFNAAKFPKLLAIKNDILENPKIKAWVAKRPKTEF